MRLTWQSKMVSGSTTCPVVAFSQLANLTFASSFDLRKVSWKFESLANGLSLRNSARLEVQRSPMASVIVFASGGLHSNNQRRGVTPLVLLLKRSGNNSARFLTVILRSRPEWMAATPLVLWEPTMARLAMRTLR